MGVWSLTAGCPVPPSDYLGSLVPPFYSPRVAQSPPSALPHTLQHPLSMVSPCGFCLEPGVRGGRDLWGNQGAIDQTFESLSSDPLATSPPGRKFVATLPLLGLQWAVYLTLLRSFESCLSDPLARATPTRNSEASTPPQHCVSRISPLCTRPLPYPVNREMNGGRCGSWSTLLHWVACSSPCVRTPLEVTSAIGTLTGRPPLLSMGTLLRGPSPFLPVSMSSSLNGFQYPGHPVTSERKVLRDLRFYSPGTHPLTDGSM